MSLALHRKAYADSESLTDADGFHSIGIVNLCGSVIMFVDDRPHASFPLTEIINATMLEFIIGRQHNRQSLTPRQQTILDLLKSGF
jgi:hypothetical protein